jgi:hypothetical protein
MSVEDRERVGRLQTRALFRFTIGYNVLSSIALLMGSGDRGGRRARQVTPPMRGITNELAGR